MKTLATIRNDLKDIRYYYSRKATFDEATRLPGAAMEILETVRIYNEAARKAPARLFDLYYSLYVKNNTQESLSELLGFTPQYIQRLNTRLVQFLHSVFEKESA